VSVRTVHGQRVLRTKGDANRVPDPSNPFVLHRGEQARVAFHIPYVGYALGALSERKVRMAVIGLPALLIALLTLAGLWRTPAEART
jgi:signal peptidase I